MRLAEHSRVLLAWLLVVCATAGTADATSNPAVGAARAYDRGLRAYLRDDHATALAAFVNAAELNPDLADAYYLLGMSYVQEARWEAAASAFRRASEVDPGYVEAFAALGRTLVIGMARSSEAAEILARALELAPTYAHAWALLGHAHANSGRIHDAISAYEHATTQNPTDVSTRYELGAAYLRVGALANAAEQLDIVRRTNPHHAKAMFALGTVHVKAGRSQEGRLLLDAFQKLTREDERISLLKRRTRAPDADAWHELGLIYVGHEQWVEALAAFQRCSEVRPRDPRGQEGTGYVLIRICAYDEAMRLYADLVQAWPMEAQYRNSLGVVFLMTGRNDEAAEHFRVAAELDPTNAGPYANLAEALKRAGRTDEYRNAVQRFRELSGAGR
jgi:tetratricopeptide (TPR) repeat protein